MFCVLDHSPVIFLATAVKMVCPTCSVACSLSAYWLGASPQTFYKYYTCKAVVLYGSRFYLYKSKNWHYYMLEFCYFANILLLLEVWVFPNSPTFHKVTYALKLIRLHLSIWVPVSTWRHIPWQTICMYAESARIASSPANRHFCCLRVLTNTIGFVWQELHFFLLEKLDCLSCQLSLPTTLVLCRWFLLRLLVP